jgi:hypothetical protein
LTEEQANTFFAAHVPLGVSPKTLWAYPQSHDKKNPGVSWQHIHKMKSMLSDLLDETEGRVVKQLVFTKQLHSYLNEHKAPERTKRPHGENLGTGCT